MIDAESRAACVFLMASVSTEVMESVEKAEHTAPVVFVVETLLSSFHT